MIEFGGSAANMPACPTYPLTIAPKSRARSWTCPFARQATASAGTRRHGHTER